MKLPIIHKLAVTDINPSESKHFLFEVTSVGCRPGFAFVDQECRCNKAKAGVLRSVSVKAEVIYSVNSVITSIHFNQCLYLHISDIRFPI